MNTREVHSLLQTVPPIEQPGLGCCLGERWLAVLHLGKSENLRVQAFEDRENYHLDFHPIHESEVALLTWLLPLVSPSNPGGGETMQWVPSFPTVTFTVFIHMKWIDK